MTVQELLDQSRRTADDDSSSYETAALRWLNLVRSDVASKARWRDAIRTDTFTTDSRASGLYPLTGYEHLVDDWMFDETRENVITYTSHPRLGAADPKQVVVGPSNHWSDAGVSDDDERLIYLWPVPDGAYVIRFRGYKSLKDLTASDKEKSVDPFFGKLSEWAACFSAGLRYYYDLDDNTSAESIAVALQIFNAAIETRKSVNKTSVNSSVRLRNVRTGGRNSPRPGRFNPAHYDNRRR
jgi:hypothetical protein